MNDNERYYKFQMTYPFESNKIHKSKSLKKVVKKCYKEFKSFSDINEGLFCITNLDKDIEYRFKVKNKRIEKLKRNHHEVTPIMTGGEDVNPNDKHKLAQEIKSVIDLEGDQDKQYKNAVPQNDVKLDELTKKLDVVNEKVTKNADADKKNIEIVKQNIEAEKKKIDTVAQHAESEDIKMDILNENLTKSSENITKSIISKITETSEEEQNLLNQIMKNTSPPPPSDERKDLFYDIGDPYVFDSTLARLYALQKIKYIEELGDKNENECIIL